MSQIPDQQFDGLHYIPRPPDTPENPHLIGQEWLDHGYQSFHIPVEPDPCIVDGTPLNACTGREQSL